MKHPESEMQRACVKWFRMQYPKYAKLLFAIPNGGGRSRIEAAIMIGEGVTTGVPDLMLAVPAKGYVGAFIELKVKPNKPSKEQTEWMQLVENYGYAVVVIYTFEEFMAWVKQYLSVLSLKGIEFVVCKHYGMTPRDLHTKSQRREIVEPRQVIMTIGYEVRLGNNAGAASHFGLDGSTCNHSRRTVKTLVETNRDFRTRFQKILSELQIPDFTFKN